MEPIEYNNNQFIGVLATNEEYREAVGDPDKESVFVNSQKDIQYQVKALSENAPTRFFTGYINSINDNDLELDDNPSYYDYDDYDSRIYRIDDFRKKLKNHFFVFTTKAVPNIKGDNKKFHKINRADIVPRPAPINDDDIFITVPVFSPVDQFDEWEYRRLHRTYSNFEDFIECLKKGKTIGQIRGYEFSDCPKFIIWYDDEQEGRFCAIGPFTSYQPTVGGFTLGFDQLYEIDLSPFDDYVVFPVYINPSILHMVENVYEQISNQFVTGEGIDLICARSNDIEKKESDLPKEENPLIEIDQSIRDDLTLLRTFNRFCEDNHLFYLSKDLTNIHTALKTGNLVILSGMSGTGKSAIVDMYARALGLRNDDEDRVLIIPVRPSWNDDSDLLGYVDLIHMVYRASDTGFVRMLVEASKKENEDKLYIVCFDEMNLARVEHYFSQFLSILEKPAGRRKLRLYDEQYRGRLYNSYDYPDVITLKNNIRFIGTVNIDETTYHFADKVLDRANVINLHVLPFNSWKKHPYSSNAVKEWSSKEYYDLSIIDESFSLEKTFRDFMWDFHQILQETTTNLGIGPRVVKSIETYLKNLPKEIGEFCITVNEGIDIQVKQRILTKIRGSIEQLSELFDEDVMINLFEKYNQLSDFEESRKVVEQKKKELKIYGYCL